jgi:hypothetical protein
MQKTSFYTIKGILHWQKSRLSGRDQKFQFKCYQSENPICSNRQGLGPRRGPTHIIVVVDSSRVFKPITLNLHNPKTPIQTPDPKP